MLLYQVQMVRFVTVLVSLFCRYNILGYKLVETRSTRKVVHTHTVKKCDDCRYIYHKPRSDFVQPSHNTDEETEAQIN